MRDCRLECVEAVIEGEQRMPPKGDDDCLLFQGQHRRMRLFRSGRKIGHRCPLFPLRDGLLVDPIALGQRSQALLTILYCSTDRRCRRSAPMVMEDAMNCMRWRSLGSSGIQVSELGLGTQRWGSTDFNAPDEEMCHAMLDIATERGVNLVDTAVSDIVLL